MKCVFSMNLGLEHKNRKYAGLKLCRVFLEKRNKKKIIPDKSFALTAWYYYGKLF